MKKKSRQSAGYAEQTLKLNGESRIETSGRMGAKEFTDLWDIQEIMWHGPFDKDSELREDQIRYQAYAAIKKVLEKYNRDIDY
jgi:hypothetical protein